MPQTLVLGSLSYVRSIFPILSTTDFFCLAFLFLITAISIGTFLPFWKSTNTASCLTWPFAYCISDYSWHMLIYLCFISSLRFFKNNKRSLHFKMFRIVRNVRRTMNEFYRPRRVRCNCTILWHLHLFPLSILLLLRIFRHSPSSNVRHS